MHLPYVAIVTIMENVPSSTPDCFLKLSRVSRGFRKAFLSDTAWSRFNVYNTSDIANDYLKKQREQPRADLYHQLSTLCTLQCKRSPRSFPFQPVVWRLWSRLFTDWGEFGTNHWDVRDPHEHEIKYLLPRELRLDKQFHLDMYQHHQPFYVIREFRDNRDVMLAAVTSCGDNLVYASRKLRKDREVVMAAVVRNGYSLEFASEKLRDDPEVVIAAVSKSRNGTSFRCASERLRDDHEMVMAVLDVEHSEFESAFRYVSGRLRDHRDVTLVAFEISPVTFVLPLHDYATTVRWLWQR